MNRVVASELVNSMPCRTYETVPGYFVQDTADSEPLCPRLGLIADTPERWKRFTKSITDLTVRAPGHVRYKVFFLVRHGQGIHNVAENKYGTKDWDDHWSKLNGDGELIWGPDPELTEMGEKQAEVARETWATELSMGLPLPGKSYCSPLTRAIRTCQIIFDDIEVPHHIIENAREIIGVHTCDKRRSRSDIHSRFPTFLIEDGLTEEDELWTEDIREERPDRDRRARAVLDTIFDDDTEQFISITSHGGFIAAFLRVVEHFPCYIPTGGVIPVVVKGMIGDGEAWEWTQAS